MLVLSSLLFACTPQTEIAIDPSSASAYGHLDLTIDLTESGLEASEVRRVVIGGVDAVELRADGESLTVYAVGSPEVGAVDVVLHADEAVTFEGAFEVSAPIDLGGPLVAIGGSVTHGSQNAIIDRNTTTHGTGAYVGKAFGAYFPLPLIHDGLFPDMAAEDVGPAPDCTLPDAGVHSLNAAIEALGALFDDDAGETNFALGRLNPDHVVYNLAVPASAVADTLNAPPTDDIGEQILWHLVHDPAGDINDPVPDSQIDLLEGIGPAVVFSVDLLANDAIDGVMAQPGLDPELMRSPEEVEPYLVELLDRVQATGALLFVADVPDLLTLPPATDSVAYELAQGTSQEEIDALLDDIRARTNALNSLLYDVAAGYDNVQVVRFADEVDRAASTGIEAGEFVLTNQRFAGLLSLDGLHFSDAGYATTANLFVAAISDELGLDAPLLDVGEVTLTDRFSPAALAASGLVAADCPTP